MLKKQNQIRSILDQIYYHTNYHRSLMSYSIPTDLFSFSNGLHSRIPLSSSGNFFSFQNNATCTSSTTNSFLRIKGKTNGFVLRGCFDSNQPKAAAAAAAGHKPGAFAYQRIPQLEIVDGSTDAARLINGRGSSERGNPVGFFDNSLPEKLLVAVDVDEVLGNFVSALNRFIADRYSQNHSVSEYHVYEFFKIWNCSRDEADIRVHEFFKTPYFKTGIHPLPGAQKALHKLSQFCNLSVVTSRQNVIKDHTIEWIQKHYPGLFQEIHFGNHFALDGESRPKSEICRSLGAKVLIDDNPRYAIECAEVGIRVLLFDYENSYPWCKTDSVNQHPLVTKVHNWEEVEQQLVSWIVS